MDNVWHILYSFNFRFDLNIATIPHGWPGWVE